MSENGEKVVVTAEDVGEVPAAVLDDGGDQSGGIEAPEATVSEASDARDVSSENEPDRKARIKRDMAALGRTRRGGVQESYEETPDGTDDQ